MNPSSISEVLERHRKILMAIKGVEGVSVALSMSDPAKRCILAYVNTDQWPEGLPSEIEGVAVEIRKTTGFHAT